MLVWQLCLNHPIVGFSQIEDYLQLHGVPYPGNLKGRLNYRRDFATVSGLTSQGEIIVVQRGQYPRFVI